MTANSDKDQPDLPASVQPDQTLAATTPAGNTAAMTTTTSDTMEVHHHAHHGGKKNWKSYFWEFLMLFLAVFCGFLAENVRETQVEHHREKEFIRSYVEDLKTDTTAIAKNLVFLKLKREKIDSLIYFLREQKIKGHESDLYFLSRTLVRAIRFQNNDRTFSQLKFSGGLRLIRNEKAADTIIAYQKLIEYIMSNQDDERIERRAADPLLSRIFNPFVFDNMLDEFNNINRPAGNPPLRSYDPDLQLDLAYNINQLKGSNIILKTRLELLYIKAKNIIAFLQQEYNLPQ